MFKLDFNLQSTNSKIVRYIQKNQIEELSKILLPMYHIVSSAIVLTEDGGKMDLLSFCIRCDRPECFKVIAEKIIKEGQTLLMINFLLDNGHKPNSVWFKLLCEEIAKLARRVRSLEFIQPIANKMHEVLRVFIEKTQHKLAIEAFTNKRYAQALRRLCATKPKKTSYNEIERLLQYKVILGIDINEQAGEKNRAALHFAGNRNN